MQVVRPDRVRAHTPATGTEVGVLGVITCLNSMILHNSFGLSIAHEPCRGRTPAVASYTIAGGCRAYEALPRAKLAGRVPLVDYFAFLEVLLIEAVPGSSFHPDFLKTGSLLFSWKFEKASYLKNLIIAFIPTHFAPFTLP